MIKNSIILNDVYLGDNTYIENCIVESRDTIRAIVGDTKYNPNAARQGGKQTLCLCAYKLEFAHPKTNERLHLQFEQIRAT